MSNSDSPGEPLPEDPPLTRTRPKCSQREENRLARFFEYVHVFSNETRPRASGTNCCPRRDRAQQNLIRILFVRCSAADVQRYVHELERVRFTVIPDIVETPEQFVERLHSRSFDLILAEHPSLGWQETEVLEILEQVKKDIPLSSWSTA